MSYRKGGRVGGVSQETARSVWLAVMSCLLMAGWGPPGAAQDAKKEPANRPESAQTTAQADAPPVQPGQPPAPPKVGLEINSAGALAGYTLISPMTSPATYLIDMEGRVVNTWELGCNPALTAYLLDNGNLLRPGALPPAEQKLTGPGTGGRVQEVTWDGEIVWDFKLSNERQLPHHDITRLPNGNVLMIVWDKRTKEEAIAAGRRP